ncbi:hypothetical protein AN1926.2 [Aspergillus nidulans FGSC A4]|uniref:Uncharacterized protein n=1 Tax=Emericella nidulans (strain FGSC A4 / ATCC 38163 / CBS 112.46 / NRRL 194 / M139) TaxID=227321 RepID=Q5BC04_EMENI|nr:hypothetical protein [Aspergillus nidulans FGSC A4]EAA65091.1 hypothetical protein AN1926.2 [Aspergillus nidulans FGSC A4]CBF85839.1 TPA: conserved hypothetical protein [Aspergillus nidulans FGSC A4]|eukprot:XP_659530.1 hypothetical protein AN1926.2 [Aspergillus nidulans FGSC A4]
MVWREDIQYNTSNGRPVSAKWTRKDNGSTDLGMIYFEYLVDASRRAGLTGAKTYGPGVGDAFAEALEGTRTLELETDLTNEHRWKWLGMVFPLHDGTWSVGIAIRQNRVGAKKKACESTSTLDFYLKMLKKTPVLADLLGGGQLQSNNLRTTSDWSYSAYLYAGCFVDPLFSSGVHLVMNGGLSAALTICASIRGHCTEDDAIEWHTQKITGWYTRFLMIVKSSLDQVHGCDEYILNDMEEPAGFDIAFKYVKPSRHTRTRRLGLSLNEHDGANNGDDILLKVARLNRVVSFSEDFTTDVIDGMAPNMCRGALGLVPIAVGICLRRILEIAILCE